MRFVSIILALLCLPVLLAAILLAPVIVPALFVIAWLLPGFAAFRRTSGRRHWNLASYHSPHSLTWRWLLSFSLPRSRDEGRWLGFWYSPNNNGVQVYFQIARCCLHVSTQRPMWYRSLYARARDEADQLSGRLWVSNKHPHKVRTTHASA